jgi:hypothetical protein
MRKLPLSAIGLVLLTGSLVLGGCGGGGKPDKDPLPDQADQIKAKMHYSSGEQSDNARSVQALDVWRGNEC